MNNALVIAAFSAPLPGSVVPKTATPGALAQGVEEIVAASLWQFRAPIHIENAPGSCDWLDERQTCPGLGMKPNTAFHLNH